MLPVNDTTAQGNWKDSYPYAAISVFALHPMYLHMPDVYGTKYQSLLDKYNHQKQALNALSAIDYEAVNTAKWSMIEEIYTLRKQEVFASISYKEFLSAHRDWLLPYAAFCYLRDVYKTPDFKKWGKHGQFSYPMIEALLKEHPDGLGIHIFVQYFLHLQLKEAVAYAHTKNVVLKGDIAIGVYRHSVDVWQHPHLFHTEMQAGAPPDDFAVSGQNWGFPTYNWQRMKQDDYAWWRARLSNMSHYFDAIRIDHILGFFRIWSIPYDAVQGIMGHFEPSVPVHLRELYGINVSTERLLQPFITDRVLHDLFGSEQQFVQDFFLQKDIQGRWCFKEAYNTQRKIENLFAAWEKDAHNAWLKKQLFELLSNVVLMPTMHPDAFYFRFNMHKTLSYLFLDDATKQILDRLYNDYFFYRQEELWKTEAFEKLPAIRNASNMLVCGEDLGLVPKCVKEVMSKIELLSLEIQRMPKNEAHLFDNPLEAPYMSVVSPSTHDTSTIRGWWKSCSQEMRQQFAQEQLNLHTSTGLGADCPGWLVQLIIQQHLQSWAMWSLFLLQDLLGIDDELRLTDVDSERINHPENPEHYWRYRSHISVEELMQSSMFNRQIATIITQSGR